MPLTKNSISAPFQDKYTQLYNKFLGEGQPQLQAFVNEYGAVSYGFANQGLQDIDPSNPTVGTSTNTSSDSGLIDQQLNKLKNRSIETAINPSVDGGPGATGPGTSSSDSGIQDSQDATAGNIGNVASVAGTVASAMGLGPVGLGLSAIGAIANAVADSQASAATDANSQGMGLDASSAIGDAVAGAIGDAGGVAGPGSGGVGDSAGSASSGVGGDAASDASAGVGNSGEDGGVGDGSGGAYARGGTVKTYAQNGPVMPVMPPSEGLMEPMPQDSPQEDMGETQDLKQLVADLVSGKMDKDTFVEAVVSMVQMEEPEAMPGAAPPAQGSEGLMEPMPQMAMAHGGSVRYAQGGPTIPPNQQIQGGVADPAVDTSDTVDVPTDQGGNAKLTSGEFVIPSDAARFIGHEKLMKLVQKARQDMSQTVPQVKEKGAAPPSGGGLMNKPMAPPINPSAPKQMSGNTGLLSAPPGLADRTGMIN